MSLRRMVLLLAILAPLSSSAQTPQVLRWTDGPCPASLTCPPTLGYRVYHGMSPGVHVAPIQVLLAEAPIVNGAHQYSASVPAGNRYFSVSAYNSVGEGPKSDERCRAADGTPCVVPPPPHPPPPTTGAKSAVIGFALWQAQAKVRDLQLSGETLTPGVPTMIEILTNAYLNVPGAAGPGSVRKTFDGATTCEGWPRYGYPDGPDEWAKAKILPVGSHTLKVEPFDLDNCTGLAGTPKTLTFTVSAVGIPPPPPPPVIAAPGKPSCMVGAPNHVFWPPVPGAASYRVYLAGTQTLLAPNAANPAPLTTPAAQFAPSAAPFSVEVTSISNTGVESVTRSPVMVVRAAAPCG